MKDGYLDFANSPMGAKLVNALGLPKPMTLERYKAGQPAITAVWFRCAFGLLALTLWFAAARRWKELQLPRRDALLAITAGLLMVASWVMFFEAVPRTSMSVATLVVHVQPFLIMLVGALWLGERVSRRQWGAALVALVGLALATGGLGLLSAGQPMDLHYLQGIGLALCAALAYAAAPLLLRRAHRASALVMAWWQCMAGTLALLWWPLWQGWPAWGGAWGWLAGMGVVHTGLAYVLVYAGVARLPAARMAMRLTTTSSPASPAVTRRGAAWAEAKAGVVTKRPPPAGPVSAAPGAAQPPRLRLRRCPSSGAHPAARHHGMQG